MPTGIYMDGRDSFTLVLGLLGNGYDPPGPLPRPRRRCSDRIVIGCCCGLRACLMQGLPNTAAGTSLHTGLLGPILDSPISWFTPTDPALLGRISHWM